MHISLPLTVIPAVIISDIPIATITQVFEEGEVGVSDLTWEKAFKMNIGLELGLWNELDVQLDFFKEKRTSIFMQRSTILPKQVSCLIRMPTMVK